MKLVNVFKSAAQGYGTERRVILLHGPVGSSKSTIARLLKKGLEDYSPHARGRALHLRLAPRPRSCEHDRRQAASTSPARCTRSRCKLIPAEWRAKAIARARHRAATATRVDVEGDLCPACRYDLPRR